MFINNIIILYKSILFFSFFLKFYNNDNNIYSEKFIFLRIYNKFKLIYFRINIE